MNVLFNFVFHAFIFWSFARVMVPESTHIRLNKINRVVSSVAIVMGAISIRSFFISLFEDDVRPCSDDMLIVNVEISFTGNIWA